MSKLATSTYHGRNNFRDQKVFVTLTCGCVIKLKDRPFPRGRYACPNGQGHGYSLDWLSYHDTTSDMRTENPRLKEQER